jgi:acyl-CoA thioester hydrolase
VFAQTIRRGDDLLLTSEVRVAALDAGSFRPRAIPEPLLGELKALERPRKDKPLQAHSPAKGTENQA